MTQSGIPAAERKIVIEKEEPNRLIAQDETECTVTEARFESVLVGDVVSCVWFDPL